LQTKTFFFSLSTNLGKKFSNRKQKKVGDKKGTEKNYLNEKQFSTTNCWCEKQCVDTTFIRYSPAPVDLLNGGQK